jgi:uncharacterized protein (DUF488 family)
LRQIHTIGHSTHPIGEFLALLSAHRIELVGDVRSFPVSRRWPHFNQPELKASVKANGIGYRWLKGLGGRRRSNRPDSPHQEWQHPAFRAYADYAESAEFAAELDELLQVATSTPVAVMCAEGLWWRCHRRIISDYLVLLGLEVLHIMPNGKLAAHSIPDFATICGRRIIYDGGQSRLELKP